MESEDPEQNDNINVCPICERVFTSVPGLRQHWTKGHSNEEKEAAVTKNTQDLSLQPTPATYESSYSPSVSSSSHSWNKLQFMNDDFNQHFNIITKKAGGDCLFLSLLEFLKNHKDIFNNVPCDANELRKMAVNHVLSHDINRFKHSIITNLENEIPDLIMTDTNGDSNIVCKEKYANYMSTPGKYGTEVELCALAELFGFGFYVIRQNSPSEYTCYSSESTLTTESDRRLSVHLLFTGSISSGHFRLLIPSSDECSSNIISGNYKIVKDYTSSRMTSLALASTFTQSSEQPDNNNQSDFTCNVCNRAFTSQRGLNIHRHCHDDSISSSQQRNDNNVESLATSFDDFVNLLGRCKRNIKVLKRIPRAARVSAANSLAKTIDECLTQPQADQPWMKLLTFAYSSFQVPDKSRNVSLTTLVKRNIANPTLVFKRRMKNSTPTSLSRRIEYKIAEGDVKGAVKILSSNDTLAPQNLDTLNQLRLKHPPPNRDLHFPEPPGKTVEHLIVTEKDVVRNINNFPNASASGVDGILPQHVKDLTAPQTGEAGLKLIKSITNLINFMLAGKIPSKLCAIMYGASLCALNKEEGGIRPIAVGNTFRRIAAKLASGSVRSEMSSKFAPRQVGFGTRGGCEAAAHATRTFIKKNRNRSVVVLKIDFRNAFNELDRDIFLEEMRVNCPLIYPFLWQCYASSTLLFYGDDILLSQNGAQQGDPCGPLLFCSTIQAVVAALMSEFIVFYLDDGTIAGSYDSVLRDFQMVIRECGKVGLNINPTKCELFFCSEVDSDVVSQFNDISPGIIIVNELTLLGAPITDNAFINVFKKKLGQLRLLFGRLVDLDNYQIAYYLLRNCLSISKLVFLLRTSPVWNHMDLVSEIDNCIKSTLETLTNSKLNHKQWILSSLPVRCGGLGVRRVQDLALPAFLSSVNGLSSMISIMLNQPSLNIVDISDYENGINAWQQLNPDHNPLESPHLQKQWDSVQIDRLFNGLQFDNAEDVARMLAIQKTEAGAWLHALPSRTLGTLLENNTFRIIVGLRLGLDICAPHTCVCGLRVDSKGRHGLKCKKSAGRWSRHAELNNIIKRALTTVDMPARLEPLGLFRDDGKKVDGITLIPWYKGQTLVWDATCTDTYAPSNLKHSVLVAGRAADDKARRKEVKYKSLIDRNYHFVPFAVETMGPWSGDAIKFFNELGKLISLKTEDPRSKAFLQQRISMAIQKGNAAAVMGCFQPGENLEAVFYL